MRHLEDDSGHIWLRQAATFTVEGQTRTVEIAVPLRPGADAEEIEALLREADAGMERLSRHLDARVAALSGGAPVAETTVMIGTTEPVSAAPAAPVPAPATIAEAPARPVAAPMPNRMPAAGTREASASRPAAAVPTHEPPAASRARPSGPLPASQAAATRPTSAPSSAPPATPSTVAPAPASAEPLGIADFLAAVRREFDYNPKQAMERLSVRTLSGLNLREALEMLRRQALRDGAAVEQAAPAPSTPAAPARVAPSAASAPAPAPAATTPDEPRYFEEEDDEPEMAFGLPDEDGVREDLSGYAALDGEPGDLEDELGAFDDDELEDVPDFAAPPPSARRAPSSARSAAPTAPQTTPPVAQPTAGSIAGGEARSQAMQIVGQLRGARAGGTPSAQQRTAYRNVVTNELGEARARALAQGVYHVAPDRLGPEQYDALISWGKRDTFAEEVDAVLAALRAERASGAATPNGAASKPAPTAPVQPARSTNSTSAAPRSGARGQSRPEGH